MRVLIASYYFPPAAGGGVQRVLKWATYLPDFGVEVDVIAPRDPGWIDSGGGLVVPEGTTVHRTRNPSPRSLNPRRHVAARRGLARLAARAALQPRRLLAPDMHVGWALASMRTACRVVREREIDVVLTTSPPPSTHLIGHRVRRATGVPWVADFRDSWLDSPHLDLTRASVRTKLVVNSAIAARTVAHADRILTVSEPLADDLRRRFPLPRVEVIENGIDLADLVDLPPVERDPSRMLVAYTGNFFGRQRATSFLQALDALLARRPELAGRIDVRFVGGIKEEDRALVTGSAGLRGVVSVRDFAPYRDVLSLQHAADLLFLYVASGPGSAGVFSGKVFEYVASRRPILALAPAGNVAARLVQDAGTGTVVDPDDVGQVEQALEQCLDRWIADGRREDAQVSDAVLRRISRREQAGSLAALLTEVAVTGRTPA